MFNRLHHFSTEQQFKDALFTTLVNVEGTRTNIYLDTACTPKPTIGIGFNLAFDSVRNAVMAPWGCYISTADGRCRGDALRTI